MSEKRLIDADDIIVKLEAKRNNWDNKNAMHRAMKGAYVDSILIVRDAPTVECEPDKGWISVKDRMPDDNGNYLVLNKGVIEIAPYDKEAAQEGFFPFGYEDKEIDEIGNTLIDWIEISGVTHWMPLPKKPKEVQDDAEMH